MPLREEEPEEAKQLDAEALPLVVDLCEKFGYLRVEKLAHQLLQEEIKKIKQLMKKMRC